MEKYMIHQDQRQFTFDKDHTPALTVQAGESVTFETIDCFSGQIQEEADLVGDIDFDRVNPGTGPLYIEGAEAGDVLAVHIQDIRVADQGAAVTYGVGALKDKSEIRTKILQVDEDKQVVYYNDIEIPLHKMIGVIGIAPADQAIGCGRIGDHGGNMDNRQIQAGTTVYFPVHTPGALLQIGDLHAAMGNGELDGAGLEISGEVDVQVDVIKNTPLNRPLIETADRWYTTAARDSYEESLKLAMADMQQLMRQAYGWDDTDIDIYLSLDGHVEINQGCDLEAMPLSLRVGIPKIKGKELI